MDRLNNIEYNNRRRAWRKKYERIQAERRKKEKEEGGVK
jgi:hypothetical protein